jgi:hypothetical protein
MAELAHYGCPVAVSLFLDFHLWAICALLGGALIDAGVFLDNIWRRDARESCRAATPGAPLDCGYAGLDVRNRHTMPKPDGFGTFGLGTCAEYRRAANSSGSNYRAVVQPTGSYDAFVRTPGAVFCMSTGSAIEHAWVTLPVVGLWLLLLGIYATRQRQIAKAVDEKLVRPIHRTLRPIHQLCDRCRCVRSDPFLCLYCSQLTAADYAVKISGLPRDALEEEVRTKERAYSASSHRAWASKSTTSPVYVHAAARTVRLASRR